MQPAVLIVGGAEIGAGKVGWAQEQGLHVLVADRDPDAPGMLRADTSLPVDREHTLELIAKTCTALRGLDLRGVYCGIDLGVTPTVVAEALGAPTISLRAAAFGQHKWLMKRAWLEAGIATPSAAIMTDEAEVVAYGHARGYPLVLKVLGSSGSRGVRQVSEEGDVREALEDLKRFRQPGDGILVEEFVEGTMHDVNGLFWDGRFFPCGMMDRFFLPGPHCMSAYTVDPSELDESGQRRVYALLEAAARALGLTHGPVKADVVWGKAGPMILEIAPRFHGDIQTANTSPLGTGINAFKAYFSALSNGKVDTHYLERSGSAVAGWKSIPFESGTFVEVSGRAQALSIDGVEHVYVYRKPGQKLTAQTDNTQMPGVVVARASTRQQLDATFDAALRVLRCVTTRPEVPQDALTGVNAGVPD